MPEIKTQREDIISQEEVRNMIRIADNLRDMCLVSILYIFGSRISEAIRLKKSDFKVNETHLFIKITALKRREIIPYKHIIKVSLNTPFIKYIADFIKNLEEEEYLFSSPARPDRHISRSAAYKIIKTLNPNCYPHLFRHTRASKLAEIGASDQQLKVWFGWCDTRPAARYSGRSPKIIESLSDQVD